MAPAPNSDCAVCKHKKLAAVDAAQDAGESEILIAQRFGITKHSLRKHAAHRAAERSPSDPPSNPPNPPGDPRVIPLPLPRPTTTPASCALCSHPKRADIETAIAAGDTWTAIARHHLVDARAVREHAEGCLRGALRRAGGEADAKAAANARARCLALAERVEALVHQAVEDEDASWRDRAALVSAAKGTLELLGRFTGEINSTTELVITESPKWKRIEAAIAAALAPYPDAAAAVARALHELEAAA
ncbi:MAG: hypothetical protein IT372_30390 [Polyangiaceae bacterium]|nr:hypothetical protein [Polyangiaceae bacterium]